MWNEFEAAFTQVLEKNCKKSIRVQAKDTLGVFTFHVSDNAVRMEYRGEGKITHDGILAFIEKNLGSIYKVNYEGKSVSFKMVDKEERKKFLDYTRMNLKYMLERNIIKIKLLCFTMIFNQDSTYVHELYTSEQRRPADCSTLLPILKETYGKITNGL
jgi:hypothetical protein